MALDIQIDRAWQEGLDFIEVFMLIINCRDDEVTSFIKMLMIIVGEYLIGGTDDKLELIEITHLISIH